MEYGVERALIRTTVVRLCSQSDPEVVAMTDLVAAYQRNDIADFERILRSNRATIMDDPFIRAHIEDLLANIRTQARLMTTPFPCSLLVHVSPAGAGEEQRRAASSTEIDSRPPRSRRCF